MNGRDFRFGWNSDQTTRALSLSLSAWVVSLSAWVLNIGAWVLNLGGGGDAYPGFFWR